MQAIAVSDACSLAIAASVVVRSPRSSAELLVPAALSDVIGAEKA